MKLHIKNLGPIKEATIDLSKRFYTFVGYNNSGKTYLANLLTGVFHQYRGLKFSNIVLKSILISDEDIINKRFVVTQKDIHSILPIYADYLKNEFLPEILNISKESPIIKKLSIAFLDVNINIKDLIYIGDRVNFNFKDVFTEIKEDRIVFNNINYDRKMHHSWESVIVYKLIQDLDLIDVSWNIDFLPTERLSFMTFYKYFYKVEQLRREEIGDFLKKINEENMDFEKLKEMSESTYTETHKQLIQKIYGLSEFIENLQKEINFENNQNSYLVKKLETIMGGKINITKNSLNSDIGFQFQIQENQELLKLHTTSSSVNQLSTLYLYWKYWDANNFPNASLFIDEPEQNLHPENQVKITELLIQFANRNNNRVLICTHSPLIAEVINNYLVLGQLENREEAREKLGLAENCFLTPEDTGIYFFTGDTVREYKISDYGRFLKILRLRRRKCGILEWN